MTKRSEKRVARPSSCTDVDETHSATHTILGRESVSGSCAKAKASLTSLFDGRYGCANKIVMIVNPTCQAQKTNSFRSYPTLPLILSFSP